MDRADRVRAQEALGIPAGASTTRATSIRVAEALEAARLVVGSYELRGAEVVLSLRLLDLERATLSAPAHRLRTAGGPALAGPRPGLGHRARRGPAAPRARARPSCASAGAVPFAAFKAYAERPRRSLTPRAPAEGSCDAR